MIQDYEHLSGFELVRKEEITNTKTFWEVWDLNMEWIRCMVDDIAAIENPYQHTRPL
jgi:hypothetical protein